MKVAVIGATGTIGAAVAAELEQQGHTVVRTSRRAASPVDLEDAASIGAFYAAHPDLNAVVSAAGDAGFGKVDELNDEGFELGLRSKLMGQVNLVREGARHLAPGTTFVLTSGILARAPWPQTAAIAMVNGAVESFAMAADLDLPDSRVMVVSPPLVRETAAAMGMGEVGPSAAEVARTYAAVLADGVGGTTTFVPGHAP